MSLTYSIIFDNDIAQSNIFKRISTKKKLKSYKIGKKESDIIIKKHSYFGSSQKVEFTFKKKLYSFSTNLIGKIQIKNIFMAILAAKNSKIKFSKIIDSVNKIKPVNGELCCGVTSKGKICMKRAVTNVGEYPFCSKHAKHANMSNIPALTSWNSSTTNSTMSMSDRSVISPSTSESDDENDLPILKTVYKSV